MKNTRKILGMLAFMLFTLIWVCVPYLAKADNPHEHEITNIIIPQSFTQRVTEQAPGVALAIATSQLICDAGTHKNQVSIGLGSFKDDEAIALGGCKSFDNMTIKGSVGNENGRVGYGLGASFKF
jgi:hypothetical protein